MVFDHTQTLSPSGHRALVHTDALEQHDERRQKRQEEREERDDGHQDSVYTVGSFLESRHRSRPSRRRMVSTRLSILGFFITLTRGTSSTSPSRTL